VAGRGRIGFGSGRVLIPYRALLPGCRIEAYIGRRGAVAVCCLGAQDRFGNRGGGTGLIVVLDEITDQRPGLARVQAIRYWGGAASHLPGGCSKYQSADDRTGVERFHRTMQQATLLCKAPHRLPRLWAKRVAIETRGKTMVVFVGRHMMIGVRLLSMIHRLSWQSR